MAEFKSVLEMSTREFQESISRREQHILTSLGIKSLNSVSKECKLINTGLSIEPIIDDTDQSLGETWTWDWDTFYFSSEADALWFRMKWL